MDWLHFVVTMEFRLRKTKIASSEADCECPLYTMDRKAVRVMEEMTGMKIEKEAMGEKVNVCKGILGIEEKGRAEGRSAGIQHEQKLTRSLLGDNRLDDLKRALDDPAVRQKLCEEYGID